ncbi:hypothetical protein LCGC14_2388290, partial [marine sediment metagenome]
MAAGPATGLVALMLPAGMLGSAAAERLRLPRLIGWLLAGLALKW